MLEDAAGDGKPERWTKWRWPITPRTAKKTTRSKPRDSPHFSPQQTEKVHKVVSTLQVTTLHPCGFPAIDSTLFCVNIDFSPHPPTTPHSSLPFPLIEEWILQSPPFAQSKLEILAFQSAILLSSYNPLSHRVKARERRKTSEGARFTSPKVATWKPPM